MKSRVIIPRIIIGRYFAFKGLQHVWRVTKDKCSYAYPYHTDWCGEHTNEKFIEELKVAGWQEITKMEVAQMLPFMKPEKIT